jgi:hypothetical protein
VDVAREGNDRTVVVLTDGDFTLQFWEFYGKPTTWQSHKIDTLALELEVEEIRVDDAGVGGGVTDELKEKEHRPYSVRPVNSGWACTKVDGRGKPKYANLKAQLNMEMKEEVFGKGKVHLAECFRESSIEGEGTDIRYKFNEKGQFLIERKDEYRKRHQGQSPDLWDAFVLSKADLPAAVPEVYIGEQLYEVHHESNNLMDERW